jgi:hypothetical protein
MKKGFESEMSIGGEHGLRYVGEGGQIIVPIRQDANRLFTVASFVGDKPQNGRLTKIISNTVFINIMSPRMCRIENLGLCHHLPS